MTQPKNSNGLARSGRGRFLAGSLGGAAMAVAWSRPAYADTYVLRLNIPSPDKSFHFTAAARFAENLLKRSGGRVKVELYPSLQLATEKESIEGLNSGVVDIFIAPPVYLQPVVPRLQVFDLPFIFRNSASVFKMLDGPIGADLFAEMETKGIIGLGWGGGGFKQFGTSDRTVTTPANMKGLRLRIQGGPVYVAMNQVLGSVPVSIDYSEIFVSLQQHTIDGLDLPFDGFYAAKFYTVIKKVAETNHIFSILPLIAGKKKIESMPADLQKMVKDEGKSVSIYWRQLMTDRNAQSMQALKDQGVAISQTDFPAFRKAMEPLYAQFEPKIGTEFVQRVMKAAG